MEAEVPMSAIWNKILELGDLKKTYYQCRAHQEDRETNLLYQLKLHNTVGNRQLISRVLQAKPLGFTALVSFHQQIIGTASQCNLLQYEVTPTTAGTFEAVEQFCRPQPHNQVKCDFCDFSDNTLVHVCKEQHEEPSISHLLKLVKEEAMVETTTDEVDNFLDSAEEGDSCDSTSSSGVPDLVESYNTCLVL